MYPEDMAFRPEVFLRYDPEREKFGITAGLRLWLDLDEQGIWTQVSRGMPGSYSNRS